MAGGEGGLGERAVGVGGWSSPLVWEEAGEGLPEAADGLCLGLVIGGDATERLGERVGQGLRFTVEATAEDVIQFDSIQFNSDFISKIQIPNSLGLEQPLRWEWQGKTPF